MARKKPKFTSAGLRLGGFEWAPSNPRTDESFSFEELKKWATLKRKVKHGPKLTRKQRVEFVKEEAWKAGLGSSECAEASLTESIKHCIGTCDLGVLYELVHAVYCRQTHEEQESATTIEENARGFDTSDAAYLSHVVADGASTMRVSLVEGWRVRQALSKYAGQLAEIYGEAAA
jgi:hypothetical protein